LIRQGLSDRAALCRSIATSALIRHRSIIPDAPDLARAMLADPARRVRERAQFLLQESGRMG
jgi:HEAT repeat protein